jgi:hypothetical protein
MGTVEQEYHGHGRATVTQNATPYCTSSVE